MGLRDSMRVSWHVSVCGRVGITHTLNVWVDGQTGVCWSRPRKGKMEADG